MAAGTDGSCPICQESWDEPAAALPCRHRFCLGCLLRWATTNPSCPLCRTPIETVRFSERGRQDYVQFVMGSPAEAAESGGRAGRAPGRPDESGPALPRAAPSAPGTPSAAEPGPWGPQPAGGLPPEARAGLFRRGRQLLEPVRPWLRRRLRARFPRRRRLAEAAESSVPRRLCLHGPDGALLPPGPRGCPRERAAPPVRGLVSAIAARCGPAAQRRPRSRGARSPAPPAAGSAPRAPPRRRERPGRPAGSGGAAALPEPRPAPPSGSGPAAAGGGRGPVPGPAPAAAPLPAPPGSARPARP